MKALTVTAVALSCAVAVPTMAQQQDWRPAARQCFDRIYQDAVAKYGGVVNVNGHWPEAMRCVNRRVLHVPAWIVDACIGQVERSYPNPPYPSSFDRLEPAVACIKR